MSRIIVRSRTCDLSEGVNLNQVEGRAQSAPQPRLLTFRYDVMRSDGTERAELVCGLSMFLTTLFLIDIVHDLEANISPVSTSLSYIIILYCDQILLLFQ